VFAFEPSPVAFATLKRALESHSNVTLINVAVGREPGEITIYLPNSGPVHSPSVFATAGDFRGQRVPLPRWIGAMRSKRCRSSTW
jgi:FkbM family methyltransferase